MNDMNYEAVKEHFRNVRFWMEEWEKQRTQFPSKRIELDNYHANKVWAYAELLSASCLHRVMFPEKPIEVPT